MKYAFVVLCILMMFSCSSDHDVHRTAYKTILGPKMYYEEYGTGTPLLILSGGGIDRSVRDFDQCIALLNGFRVILPDSPGQGKSEQPDTLTYQLLTDYFSHFIDSLDLDSVYVMGWSDGGITALLLAAARPDKVKKVVAVGANNGLIGYTLPPGMDVSSIKPEPLESWAIRNKKSVDNYSKEIKRDWKKMMNSLNAMWYQEEYFPDSILSQIHVPVMIAQGDRDDISIAHAVSLHRMIANSQLCILPGTGHEVFKERPALIAKIASDFFK